MSAKTITQRWMVLLVLVSLVGLLNFQPAVGIPITPGDHGDFSPATHRSSSYLGGNEWFVLETGKGTDCSQTNPGPLEYCVEKKAQSGDTVYVGKGFYQSQKNVLADNLLLINKNLHLVGSCTWRATGPVKCYPQNGHTSTATSYLDGNNQQRVIAIQGPGISVTIEGFQIQQGLADHKEPDPGGAILGAGGGIYASEMNALVIKNNFFWQNHATKTGTSATDYGYGGGVSAWLIDDLDIVENMFLFNSASSVDSSGYGGGLAVSYCGGLGHHVTIRSNHFIENMVGNESTYSKGAGAYLAHMSFLDLSENIFEYHNHTMRKHYINGSALALGFNVSAIRIDHNLFSKNFGNSVVDSRGLYGRISRNTFWDNEGHGVLNIGGPNEIEIVNNFFGKVQGQFANFIDIGVSDPSDTLFVNIINNTFANGDYGIRVDAYADVDILRNIFAFHNMWAIDINPANWQFEVNENLFWANVINGETGPTFWVEDPKLVDMSNGDLHLQWGSAAIDKVPLGTVISDIDGQLRPIGSAVDLGADEYGPRYFLPLFFH